MEQIIADRRALHRIPELDRDLPRTTAYLKRALSGLRAELSEPIPGAVCAWFDNGAEHSIALRSDADALPVHEASGLRFASEIPGRMHACGHDGHMAMLLELARRMDAQRAPKNILLIFQPAEETTGGAHDICSSGILGEKRVEAVFGMHLWPDLPAGTIASRKNEMMSRSCEVKIEITGRASHIAKAEEGLDALRAGFALYGRAAEIEADCPPGSFRLLRFGRMESGEVCNAVSAHTRLEGTLRAFQDEIFYGMLDRLHGAAREIEAESGCKIEIKTSEGYPPVMNSPALYDRARALGLDFSELKRPVMITEDFSWYQRALPGLFFFLGCGPAPALHAADFRFDERVLKRGADFLNAIAMNW